MAEAKSHLSELIAAVEAGEDIVITKRGKAVVRLVPKASRWEPGRSTSVWLHTALEGLPYQEEDAGTFMRRVRDTDRY